MTYEKDIPDFALVPAREPEERILIPITQGAIYSPVQVTNITEKPKTVITLEEDVLVPDTRPDLREILMIDGRVRLAGREVEPLSGKEDYISLSGDLELQTLYIPEKRGVHGPVISISSRVPFRDQWHTSLTPGATMLLDASVETIDYMVINERKFRVKVTLSIQASEYLDSKIDLFEGLTEEPIQTLRETVEITNVALRKKDMITIGEDLEKKDGETDPQNILMQHISVVENYKQATGEKVVINGFIYVNLLYTSETAGAGEADLPEAGEECDSSEARLPLQLCQLQDRVEFTQFIPLSQTGQWSGSNVCFDGSDLKVKLTRNEEGQDVFRLEGDITTWITLYRNVEKEIIVDGYHREKDFVCEFEKADCRTLVGTTVGETTVREVLALDHPAGDADRILYACGEVMRSESRAESGKVITEGTICGKLICENQGEGEHSGIFSCKQEIPFRCVTAAPQVKGNEIIRDRIYLKDLWAEKLSGKQVEFNAVVMVSGEVMRQAPFKVLKNPAFEEVSGGRKQKPMVVYITRQGDTLWSIAKRFQSTVDTIRQINQMEDNVLTPGQKLLILR